MDLAEIGATPKGGVRRLTLTDVDRGHLMWTGKVRASGSQDINQQLASLARNGIEAAQRAGMF